MERRGGMGGGHGWSVPRVRTGAASPSCRRLAFLAPPLSDHRRGPYSFPPPIRGSFPPPAPPLAVLWCAPDPPTVLAPPGATKRKPPSPI